MGIIYILTNNINNKHYVGQTTQEFKIRFRQHQHSNSYIGKAISKYGSDNFDKLLLENIPDEELDYWETYYIQKCNSISPNGYNFESGGNKNKHHHEETKRKLSKKISKTLVGNKRCFGNHLTEEHKRKVSQGMKGKNTWNSTRIVSTETRKKMSEAHKGKNIWSEGRVSPRKGVKLTEETKRKISEAQRNRHK
jgi:group I intron endonuclease